MVKSLSAERVGRQPRPPGARDRGRACSTASGCRTRGWRRGWPTSCRPWPPPAPGWWRRIWGTTRGRLREGGRRAGGVGGGGLGRGGGGQPELPQPGGRAAHVRLRPVGHPGGDGGGGGRRPAGGRRGPSSAPTSPTSSRSRWLPTQGGASALTLVNTVKGMAIDPSTRRPRLGTGGGGLSGAAIRPVAVRAIFDVHEALPDVPLVGVGGVAVRRARGGAPPGGGVGGAGGDGHLRGPPGLRAGAGRAGGVVPAPPGGAGRRSGRTGAWSSVTA